MDKLGYIILFLAFPLSYSLRYNFGFGRKADYLFIFMICFGVGLLSLIRGLKEMNIKGRYLFYYVISIFNFSIISMYIIDLSIDPIFNTGKVIWSIILTTTISLCIYLFQRKY